jgi:hypothetical protein
MKKNEPYHESAILYNEILAQAAESAAERVPHPVVKKWCVGIGKQHRFHEARHRAALEKLQQKNAATAEKENNQNG